MRKTIFPAHASSRHAKGIAEARPRFASLLLAAATVALAACSPTKPSGETVQGSRNTSAASPAANPANQALDAAASPAENLVEAVLAKDNAAGDKAYADLQQAMGKLGPAQLGKNAMAIQELSQSLNAGWQANDRPAAAMAAVSLYARLQQAKDWTGAAVPLEVSMLDHAGFKTELLAAKTPADWAELGVAAAAAQRDLAALGASLQDANLKTVAGGIVGQLAAGVKTRDIERVKLAARDLLAVVDLLEQQYTRQAALPAAK